MESIDEASGGYPEEAPPGTDPGGDAPEGTPQREGAKAPHPRDERGDDEEGTATGNPRSAG